MRAHPFIVAVAASCSLAWGQHGSIAVDGSNAGVHYSAAQTGPVVFGAPAWVFPASDALVTDAVVFAGESGVVAMGPLVYAVSVEPARVWAIDRAAGVARWSAGVATPVLDSWSTPTADPGTNAVYVASGSPGFGAAGEVRALDARDGAVLWTRALAGDVVNASPTVTSHLGARDRLFITDYEGFYAGGDGGSLHAINVDPRSAENPFDPGDAVWRAPLFAAVSGATPAVRGGRVVVATAGDGLGRDGRVVCFDATSDTPRVLWDATIAGADAFFGGVSFTPDGVYAATYAFSGDRRAGRLVRLDPADGGLIWSTPCNRTSSIPVVLPGGRVLVSGGLTGFGTLPSLALFDDLGGAFAERWDTVDATWADDGDGLIEPGEHGVFGGWTQQPAVVLGAPGFPAGLAYAGSLSDTTGLFAGYGEVRALDLSREPGEAGFVVDAFVGAGSSPAVSGGMVFTIGADGVFAFGRGGARGCACVRCEPARAIDAARAGVVDRRALADLVATPCRKSGVRR